MLSLQLVAFQFTVVKAAQSLKALSPISVSAAGTVTLVKPVLLKAYRPISVTELGMVTEVKEVKSLHNPEGILFTALPKTTDLRLVQPSNREEKLLSVQLVAFQFTVVKAVHFSKAKLPNVVTEAGMVTFVNPVQLENACCPISVTELGMVTEVKLLILSHNPEGILFTLLPMLNVLRLVQSSNRGEGYVPLSPQFVAFQFTVVKPVQPEKA